MSTRVVFGGLSIDQSINHVVVSILKDTGISPRAFWEGFENAVNVRFDQNTTLLSKRVELQRELNLYHASHPNPARDLPSYTKFLQNIGYLEPVPGDAWVIPSGVDHELSELCGPQLVVPLDNARFAVSAANARWGEEM